MRDRLADHGRKATFVAHILGWANGQVNTMEGEPGKLWAALRDAWSSVRAQKDRLTFSRKRNAAAKAALLLRYGEQNSMHT